MPRPCFTVEQAKAAGQRSAQLRAERKLNPPTHTPTLILEALTDAQPTLSPYAQKLAHAQNQLLDELLSAESAKDKAALAQALKNLRETYHLATGLAKPGVRKPERVSTRTPASQPSGPELPPDTTTGGGSAGQ